MAEPLKNLYSPSFFDHLGDLLADIVPHFSKDSFIHDIHDNGWEDRELKERMVHIANVLHHLIPGDYNASVKVILNLIRMVPNSPLAGRSFEFIFLPDYIERYGLDHYQESVAVMESCPLLMSRIDWPLAK